MSQIPPGEAPISARLSLKDAEAAALLVEHLIPDADVRRTALALLVDSIDAAVTAGAVAWNLAVREGPRLQLNVGMFSMLKVYGERVVVGVDETSVPKELAGHLEPAASGESDYKRLEGSRSISIVFGDLEAVLGKILPAHIRLVERAAPSVKRPWTWDNHYGGVTAYMREFLGHAVPDPVSYDGRGGGGDLGPRLAEIGELFREFLENYPASKAGPSHIALYARGRETASKYFDEIRAAAGRGEDVTDLILRKLLPHADTQGNRERDAWIHVAPAITKDVKQLFEGAGWAKPEQWPAIASAILSFVEQCVDDPERLADACREFGQKGLQSGMVTPILNSLRPDRFLVLNTKSKALINYLSGTRFSTSLAEYPEANRAGLDLLRDLAPMLDHPERPAELSDADLLDMFGHWLFAIRKFSYGKSSGAATASPNRPAQRIQPDLPEWVRRNDEVHYWKVAPGENGWQWDEFRKKGFVAIGWGGLGDVSAMTREEFDSALESTLDENPEYSRTGARQVWRFASIKVGDRIVVNRGISQVLGIGTVVGPYAYIAGGRHAHLLPVRWDDLRPRRYEAGRGWQRTLRELTREQFEAICKAPSLAEPAAAAFDDVEEPEMPTPNEEYSLSALAVDTGFDEELLARWVRAIDRKGQAILYGPPGTGKTFVADGLARHLVGGGYGLVETVQFHPAYAYEDFMLGIRPAPAPGGGLAYPLVPGRFVDFCDRAKEYEGTSVLIVDEINRANLARVFGELMYLLEYRDRRISLAGGREFSIPENVRVLGTMNTADRSIALVDHALRRRFAFLALYPNYGVIRRRHRESGFPIEGLIDVLDRLNRAIADPHYEVGIAFFLGDDLVETVEDIWRMEIEPYIEEYFFDRRNAFEQFRWERVAGEIVGRRPEPE